MQAAFGTDDFDGESRPQNTAASAAVPVGNKSSGLTLAADNSAAAKPAAGSSARAGLLIKRQATVLGLLAGFIDQRSLQTSLMALVGELHQRFRCDRVAIGLADNQGFRIAAISQQASIDTKSGETRLLADAMQEACAQDLLMHYPLQDDALRIVAAHRSLCSGRAQAQVCTVPLCHQGEVIGALLFEVSSSQRWTSLTLELMQQIADVIAPLVVLRRAGERGLPALLAENFTQAIGGVLQPRYLAAKLISLLFIGVLMAANFITVTHRVTASAELIADQRRVITAPFIGFIDSVHVSVGDQVKAGDALLDLDTTDLELQRAKWQNGINSAKAEMRSAMASHDRKDMAVSQARQEQARAQLALVDQQIARSQLLAPVDGVIVTGDLSQSTGAPIDRGVTLLEIAPAEGYAVHLLVDETEISRVAVGQPGKLSLKASPGDALAFEISAIHPIAQPFDGMNRFRVEARLIDGLTADSGSLRPGQTGIGKLAVGEASLYWIWTHRFAQWARQLAWQWFA